MLGMLVVLPNASAEPFNVPLPGDGNGIGGNIDTDSIVLCVIDGVANPEWCGQSDDSWVTLEYHYAGLNGCVTTNTNHLFSGC